MNSIEQYICELPEVRCERGRMLDQTIRCMFPEVKVDMQYRMPTYHLRGHVLAWGSQKGHVAVYTCSAVRLEAFRKRHPKLSCGVGCVRIRDGDALSALDVQLLVKDALAPSRSILAREQRMVAAGKKTRSRR